MAYESMTDIGRVYVGPEPDCGPHPGYRGRLFLNPLGVHISADCEQLVIGVDDIDPLRWPDSTWSPVEIPCLLPWQQVSLIEWGERFATTEEQR